MSALPSPLAAPVELLPAPGKPKLHASSDSNIQGDGFTNVQYLRMEGKDAPNAWISVYVDREPGSLIAEVQADAEGNWTASCKGLDFGEYTITTRQKLTDGDYSPFSEGLHLTIRNEPNPPSKPRLEDDSDKGKSSDDMTMERQPVVIGWSDANAVVKLYLVGAADPVATVTANEKGRWSYQFDKDLADGSYQLAATQTLNGFTSSLGDPFTLIIDNTVPASPTIHSLYDEDDTGIIGDHLTRYQDAALVGKAANGYRVYLVDTATNKDVGWSRIPDSGDWKVELDDLPDGTYTIVAEVESISGVLSGRSAPYTVTIDTVADEAPTQLALAPETDSGKLGDGITEASELVITGRGAPGSLIKIFLGKAKDHSGFSTVDEHGNWRIKVAPLPPGDYELEAVQWDAADNESAASQPVKVTILPSPVQLDAASDSGVKGDGITNHELPTLRGTGRAGNHIELHDGVSGRLLGKAEVDAKGEWQITVDSKLAEGTHHLVAYESKDQAAVSTQEMTLLIDTTKPGKLKLSNSVVEANQPKNTVVGTLSAEDAGSGKLSYKVAPTHSDGFAIEGDTLVIRDPKLFFTEHQVVPIEVTDAAGNSTVVQVSVLVKRATPPEPKPEPEPEPIPLVDGVAVSKGTVALPDGTLGQSLIVPVVGSERVDSSGAGATADIPLVDQGQAKLSAHLPTGLGLKAMGRDSQAAGQALDHLLAVIKGAASEHPATELNVLTSKGAYYLQQLAADTGVLVESLTLSGNASRPAGALTLNGTARADQHTALVIDTQSLKAGAAIVLQNVSFASVIGAAELTGNTAGQILSGDQASQHFTVHSGAGGKVFAGGGNDVLQFGGTTPSATLAGATAKPAATLLDGGQGEDSVHFLGKQAEYLITRHDGYVSVASLARPQEVATVVNAEKLQFSDGELKLEARSELSSLAALYQNVLGRQADAQGFDFWGQAQDAGFSMGRIALEMIASPEGRKQGFAFHGKAEQDLTTLYQAIFERAPDAGGLAFYLEAMQKGVTLEQVADSFLHSVEMVGFNKAQSSWDFSF